MNVDAAYAILRAERESGYGTTVTNSPGGAKAKDYFADRTHTIDSSTFATTAGIVACSLMAIGLVVFSYFSQT